MHDIALSESLLPPEKHHNKNLKFAKLAPFIGCFGGIFIIFLITPLVKEYQVLREAFENGHYMIVEGEVAFSFNIAFWAMITLYQEGF